MKLIDHNIAATPNSIKITFAEYLNYEDGTNKHYELVNGRLIEMPPASFLHSDIIDFIADYFKAIARQYKLDIKVKTGDVGVKTGVNSSRIPDISVIAGQVWQSYRRSDRLLRRPKGYRSAYAVTVGQSAFIEDQIMLAVEVVSPGEEQIARYYTYKVQEYQDIGIPEYWIVDPIEQKIAVLILKDGSYIKTIFTGEDEISSSTFPQLQLTATEILEA
ncbi:MAG: Uma2 family endonuclease [Cyanobacteria bacterium P01_G01_bin.67]